MTAKATGDLFNKSIYDVHIDLKHVLLLAKQYGILFADSGSLADSSGMVPFRAMIRNGFPECPTMARVKAALTPEDDDMCMDLLPYTNQGCHTVQEHAVAMRCYTLFRTMGLRHLPVLCKDHTVSGMLTRKDLLAAAEHNVKLRKRSKSRLRKRTKGTKGNKYTDAELASV